MSESVEKSKQFCPRCGNAADADARFCKHCAFDLSASSETQTALPNKESSRAKTGSPIALAVIVLIAAVIALTATFFANRKQSQPATENTYRSSTFLIDSAANSAVTSSATSPAVSTSPAAPNRALTNSQIESAVSEMLAGYRLAGSVSVRGIQELPQQNAAVADLRFNDFQYPVGFEGNLLRVKDFKPKKPSGALIPSPEEMFPPRRVTYSKDGKATLTKYTDGRWVLKQVSWAFDTSVKGNVEIP